MYKKNKFEKEIKRKQYNLIRHSNSSLIHDQIKSNVKSGLKILVNKYHDEEKYIGLYWPLKGEIDLRVLRKACNTSFALPACNEKKGMTFHPFNSNNLRKDFHGIPSPIDELKLKPQDFLHIATIRNHQV